MAFITLWTYLDIGTEHFFPVFVGMVFKLMLFFSPSIKHHCILFVRHLDFFYWNCGKFVFQTLYTYFQFIYVLFLDLIQSNRHDEEINFLTLIFGESIRFMRLQFQTQTPVQENKGAFQLLPSPRKLHFWCRLSAGFCKNFLAQKEEPVKFWSGQESWGLFTIYPSCSCSLTLWQKAFGLGGNLRSPSAPLVLYGCSNVLRHWYTF